MMFLLSAQGGLRLPALGLIYVLPRDGSAAARGPRAADNSPSFALRGMHLNGWAFGYPYTFRCWQETDWQRYADMLAAQGARWVDLDGALLLAEDRPTALKQIGGQLSPPAAELWG